MPTVLFLIDTLQTGGAEKSLLDILSRFKKYKPVVCHIYPGEELKNKFEASGIPVISLNIQAKFGYEQAIQQLLPILEKHKPVIVHSTLYKADMISRKLKSKNGLPLVNSFVNNSYSKTRYRKSSLINKLKLYSYQRKDAASVGSADLFISNSETIKLSNSIALKIPLEKIITIFRGRSFDKFKQPDTREIENIRQQYNPNEKYVMLNVSRLLERKGQLDLLMAFAAFRKKVPASILLIAGEGDYRTVLEKTIREMDLADSVVLLGSFNKIPELLAIADCFVFPTYYEGLPGALIEAMMAGKIIVASDIPENRECVDNTSALFFTPGDRDKLAVLMEEAIMNKSKYDILGKNAATISQDKFDIDRVAERYETAYDQLLNKK